MVRLSKMWLSKGGIPLLSWPAERVQASSFGEGVVCQRGRLTAAKSSPTTNSSLSHHQHHHHHHHAVLALLITTSASSFSFSSPSTNHAAPCGRSSAHCVAGAVHARATSSPTTQTSCRGSLPWRQSARCSTSMHLSCHERAVHARKCSIFVGQAAAHPIPSCPCHHPSCLQYHQTCLAVCWTIQHASSICAACERNSSHISRR